MVSRSRIHETFGMEETEKSCANSIIGGQGASGVEGAKPKTETEIIGKGEAETFYLERNQQLITNLPSCPILPS